MRHVGWIGVDAALIALGDIFGKVCADFGAEMRVFRLRRRPPPHRGAPRPSALRLPLLAPTLTEPHGRPPGPRLALNPATLAADCGVIVEYQRAQGYSYVAVTTRSSS
jgi:hypothetical protein